MNREARSQRAESQAEDVNARVRVQTEKQRIIWAYKILFLDVLFPLSLRKVIFVDSDQIVRADFAELWHMDLKVRGCSAGTTSECGVTTSRCHSRDVSVYKCMSLSAGSGEAASWRVHAR